ncbi:cupin domain-containing protein [Rhodococcus sp. WS1]|uniref:(R)-mandelonitrile lyase n=1 Tax=unclassified Rhodococcus (in: high G+C Gram-positive bacteria) TaxID=192944 RepID=UPI00114447E3|nr:MULTISPECIES: cupin domain-containing protein [unclassified Rhodococcus (in: high G+C Gram-positive bacteria)]ROZ52931.1 cupin domain-containing protein [Rhodococcus sp. WS1]TQC36022.1 cupin domain-containing protein [Rhodococcus sp. WS7]
MEILPSQPSAKGPSEIVSGDVWFDNIVKGEEPSRVRAVIAHFAPCARTGWHTHAVGQTLHILQGIALVQSRGGEVIEAHPGDTIYTPPGEWHWHGAASDRYMTHLSVTEAPEPGTGPEVEWGEPVSDAEYTGPRRRSWDETTQV